ncbi:MAG: methylmalonyl-CoA epimerase [Planctomycetota bacterium]
MDDPSPPRRRAGASLGLEGFLLELDHVAIAVPSLAEARAIFVAGLGFQAGEVEPVPGQKVNVLFCRAGGQRIELVEPAAPDSPLARFLARRGGGLHHLAWRVSDIEAALSRLQARGIELIDAAPRPGAHGTRIAFLHPRSTGGVLTELVELPSASG